MPEYHPLPVGTERLRAEVRDYLRTDRDQYGWHPRVDAWLSSWDAEFSRRLAARGWLGMTIPTEYGGKGIGHVERFVVTEELLAAGAPVAAHWIADRQAAPSLVKYGTESQRQTYLPAIARGECYFGIGMSEPESGSDLASVRTRAVEVEGGWEVTGTKVWTSGAHLAHAFFVLARNAAVDEKNRHAGLSQFIVPLDSPGVEIRPIRLLTGAHHFNEVVLTKVFVPDDGEHNGVLGRIGDGWAQVTSELGFERSGPERILSTHQLLEQLAAVPGAEADIGGLVAQLVGLRQLSASVAGALADGASVGVAAALVKDMGTRYESAVIDVAAAAAEVSPSLESADDLSRMLAEAILHSPGFTLRGGTNEILRGVVARGLGLR